MAHGMVSGWVLLIFAPPIFAAPKSRPKSSPERDRKTTTTKRVAKNTFPRLASQTSRGAKSRPTSTSINARSLARRGLENLSGSTATTTDRCAVVADAAMPKNLNFVLRRTAEVGTVIVVDFFARFFLTVKVMNCGISGWKSGTKYIF